MTRNQVARTVNPRLKQLPKSWLDGYRRQLTHYEALLPYSVLGVVGGVTSGLMVLLFELAIRQISSLIGIGAGGEGFEALPQAVWFALPCGGALLLGVLFSFLPKEDRDTGIVHVLSRMHSHYGALPWRNAAVQFLSGVLGLASGQSGGREGPGVHLGGAINSLLGQWLRLPNNSLRVLIACGTAGGISAAFHTPLAGVIFAMEVIMVEYTVVGFIPVILAAVAASAISHFLSPSLGFFELPDMQLETLSELPFVMFVGFCCGVAVALFIQITKLTAHWSDRPVLLRFALAGAITGGIAWWVPQVLGMGYDTLEAALQGKLGLSLLLTIALAKLVATAVSCGAGLPLGLIGPNLLIGACLGGALGLMGAELQADPVSRPEVYMLLGMGAAMAAVLNAPLAAILAIVEMTDKISLGMPAMLAIVTATLTCNGLFRQHSAHQTVLAQAKRSVPDDPLNHLLHRTDVSSTMDNRVVRVPVIVGEDDMEPLLEFKPTWCVICRGEEDLYIVDGATLLDWLLAESPDEAGVDVTESDMRRWTIAAVPLQATLRQALDNMREATAEAVCVYGRTGSSGKRILHGVVTRDNIEKFTLGKVL